MASQKMRFSHLLVDHPAAVSVALLKELLDRPPHLTPLHRGVPSPPLRKVVEARPLPVGRRLLVLRVGARSRGRVEPVRGRHVLVRRRQLPLRPVDPELPRQLGHLWQVKPPALVLVHPLEPLPGLCNARDGDVHVGR